MHEGGSAAAETRVDAGTPKEGRAKTDGAVDGWYRMDSTSGGAAVAPQEAHASVRSKSESGSNGAYDGSKVYDSGVSQVVVIDSTQKVQTLPYLALSGQSMHRAQKGKTCGLETLCNGGVTHFPESNSGLGLFFASPARGASWAETAMNRSGYRARATRMKVTTMLSRRL